MPDVKTKSRQNQETGMDAQIQSGRRDWVVTFSFLIPLTLILRLATCFNDFADRKCYTLKKPGDVTYFIFNKSGIKTPSIVSFSIQIGIVYLHGHL